MRPPPPIEREAEERAKILEAVDQLMPGVVGNRYIPHWPHPPQARFLGMHIGRGRRVFEALFGGSAGGGKSDALLMGAAQFVHVPGFAALILRRTFQDLSLPGAIMDRAISWWKPMAAAPPYRLAPVPP